MLLVVPCLRGSIHRTRAFSYPSYGPTIVESTGAPPQNKCDVLRPETLNRPAESGIGHFLDALVQTRT